MAMDHELAYQPLYRLRELIAAKELSPVELVEATLERIDHYNSRLGAFITVTHDLALEQAREAEAAVLAGEPLGLLHGIPVPIKDLEGVQGVRFTHGSVPADEVAASDALCVERVKDAGGIIIGKTNTPEFGFSGTTENLIYGPCRNPWNPERTSGGSSGGAGAAVAAGLTSVAQGSDGGGSIRIPSCLNGIYGLKATQGRIPRRHADMSSWNPINNSSVGPMTRTVRDAAILAAALAGPAPDAEYGTIQEAPPDFEAALDRGVRGLKVGFNLDLGGAVVDPQVAERVVSAVLVFDELGARVEEVTFGPERNEVMFQDFFDYFAAKGYACLGQFLDDRKSREQLTDYFRETLEHGRSLSAADCYRSLNKIGFYRAETSRFFGEYDLLLTPVTSVWAFPIGRPPEVVAGRRLSRPAWRFFPFTFPFNVTENPAASVPCGFSSDGLPIGLQIVGRWGDEETVLAASAAFEKARPWAGKRPPEFDD